MERVGDLNHALPHYATTTTTAIIITTTTTRLKIMTTTATTILNGDVVSLPGLRLASSRERFGQTGTLGSRETSRYERRRAGHTEVEGVLWHERKVIGNREKGHSTAALGSHLL